MKNNYSWLQTCFVGVSKTVLAVLTVITLGMTGQMRAADEYWRTDGASDGTWISNYWNVGSANAAGGTGWTNGNNAVFTANSILTFATATVGNVTVSDNQTVTVTNGGSLTLGGVRTFDIGTGATLTWTGQGQSIAVGNEGAGIVKNGTGILNWGAGPGSGSVARFDGGFTLNAGTIIVSGKYAFGTGVLTINGGTIQSSGGNSYVSASLAIGGNFTFAGTSVDIYGMPINLGSATRIITNSITAGSGNSRIFTGQISGDSGAGLTFAGTSTMPMYVSNPANDFTGSVTFNSGGVGFASDGSFGALPGSVTTNAIVIDGGQLISSDTSGNAVTNTINANRGIQIGATAGTSISVAKTNGFLTYNGVIADKPGSAGILVKQGAGTLILGGANTFSGGTFVNSGALALSVNGAISGSPLIEIASGATFDVSAFTSGLTLGNSQTLKASGTTSAGTIATGSGAGLALGATSRLQFSAFKGTTAPLIISGSGAITLAVGNVVTVTNVNGSAFATGDYRLISTNGAGGGVVASSTLPPVTVYGDGIIGGTTSSLVISNAELYLHVAAGAATPATNRISFNGTTATIGVAGAANTHYVLLTTTSLTNPANLWLPIQTNTTDGTGITNFIDLNATNRQQFYRIKQLP